MSVFRTKQRITAGPSALKSVDEMRCELKETLERLDKSAVKSKKNISRDQAEKKSWAGRVKETQVLIDATDDPGAKEALQMLQIQAGNYRDYFVDMIESETAKYDQLSNQADELRRAVNLLEIEDMKTELRNEISVTGSTVYDKTVTPVQTISEESEREVQRLILNAEALLEVKENQEMENV